MIQRGLRQAPSRIGGPLSHPGHGDNAVLANVAIDLAERPESASLAQVANVSLICSPDEARWRLKRVAGLGFDEILLVSQSNSLEEIERVRDFL